MNLLNVLYPEKCQRKNVFPLFLLFYLKLNDNERKIFSFLYFHFRIKSFNFAFQIEFLKKLFLILNLENKTSYVIKNYSIFNVDKISKKGWTVYFFLQLYNIFHNKFLRHLPLKFKNGTKDSFKKSLKITVALLQAKTRDSWREVFTFLFL